MTTKELINQFKNKKILVIGDIMLDKYTYGAIERISPEAPVPIVKKKNEQYVLGGAANVANAIIDLQAKVILCGCIGNDDTAIVLLKLLAEKGILTKLITVNKEKRNTLKHRIISGNQQVIRIDEEDSLGIDTKDEKKLLELLEVELQKCDGVILSDYNKGFFQPKLTKDIIKLANKYNKKII